METVLVAGSSLEVVVVLKDAAPVIALFSVAGSKEVDGREVCHATKSTSTRRRKNGILLFLLVAAATVSPLLGDALRARGGVVGVGVGRIPP